MTKQIPDETLDRLDQIDSLHAIERGLNGLAEIVSALDVWDSIPEYSLELVVDMLRSYGDGIGRIKAMLESSPTD